jgi:hypothetical protein
MKDSFLCTLSFLKISVASSKCWFSKILQLCLLACVRVYKRPGCCLKQFASWQ